MRRGEAAAAIAAAIGPDTIVVCSLGSTSRAWRSVGAPNPTYYGSDPMGLAASLALGLALAVRPRRVVHLAGDGDLVMNLQVLLAISGAPSCPLATIVFANHRYETGGGQPLPGNADTDLELVGRGAGLHVVASPATPTDLALAVPQLWGAAAPGFCVLTVEPEASPYGGPGDSSGVEERTRFLDALRLPPATTSSPTLAKEPPS